MDAKPIPWDPITGVMDNRSHPAEMPDKSFRLIQNFYIPDENTMRRRGGFEKLHTRDYYRNGDLHDQLLVLQQFYQGTTGESLTDQSIQTYPNASCSGPLSRRFIGRQPITFLYSARASTGVRRLIAATESRIYVADEAAGTWRLIADGMGTGVQDGTCPGRRFKATQNGDIVVFTNDYDEPVYWPIDGPVFGCAMQSVSKIPDMEVIGLSRAGAVWTFRGVTHFGNVELDRIRVPEGIVWADKDNPISLDPSLPESLAGSKFLSPGEKVLAGVEINNVCIIFTDRRIWQESVVGGEETFLFEPRYTPKETGQGCLRYANTLVVVGDAVYYAGEDGFYKYDLYSPEPVRLEWLHRGTKVMFGNINKTLCENHVTGYWPINEDTREIFISWVEEGDNTGFPSQTLVIDTKRERTSLMDVGMTAACYHEIDLGISLRQWLIEQCACSAQSLADLGYGYIKEELPRPTPPATCPEINSIHTNTPLTVGDLTTEDYDRGVSDADSFCARVGGVSVQDLCQGCAGPKKFVFASSADWCLKEMSQVNFREINANPSAEGVMQSDGYMSVEGEYATEGYDSILRTGGQHFGTPGKEKELRFFQVEAKPEPQTVPSQLQLRVGMSSQAADPNLASSGIVWSEEDPKLLEDQSVSAARHVEEGTRPDEGFRWPTFTEGRYLYWELKISGKGGDVSFGRVEQYVQLTSRKVDA